MSVKISSSTSPGANDLAQHPKLWGHPLPRWGENGLTHAEGSHWDDEAYTALTLWLGRALDAINLWIYGAASHRRTLTQRERISRACAQARADGAEVQDFASKVDAYLPNIVLTRQDEDQIEAQVQHADRARVKLWAIANASDPRTRPQTIAELASWTTKHHIELVLRMAAVGLVPKPPESIIPKNFPIQRGPGRHAKMNSKPTENPAMEDVFT